MHPTKESPCKIKLKDGTIINGVINTIQYERLSDIFTKPNSPDFVILYKATTKGVSGKILFVNKSDISWVEPED